MRSSNHSDDSDDLIEQYRKYVKVLANRLMRLMGLPLSMRDDLVAAGYLGLVEATRRYDPSANVNFKSFAFLRIRGAMIDGVRESSQISGKAYRYAKALQSVQDLRDEIDACSGNEALKARAESARLRLARCLDRTAKGVIAYKLGVANSEKELNAILDPECNPEEKMILIGERKEMREMVETLPEKERYIIQQHYFRGKSFVDIARENDGMSKSWVSKLHARALQRLQSNFISPGAQTASNGSTPSVANL